MQDKMDTNIILLNCLRYPDKVSGEPRSVLQYIFYDKQYYTNETNYMGYAVLSQFYNRDVKILLDVIPEIIGKPLKCTLVSRTKYKDPTQMRYYIEKINYGGKDIYLLQS